MSQAVSSTSTTSTNYAENTKLNNANNFIQNPYYHIVPQTILANVKTTKDLLNLSETCKLLKEPAQQQVQINQMAARLNSIRVQITDLTLSQYSRIKRFFDIDTAYSFLTILGRKFSFKNSIENPLIDLNASENTFERNYLEWITELKLIKYLEESDSSDSSDTSDSSEESKSLTLPIILQEFEPFELRVECLANRIRPFKKLTNLELKTGSGRPVPLDKEDEIEARDEERGKKCKNLLQRLLPDRTIEISQRRRVSTVQAAAPIRFYVQPQWQPQLQPPTAHNGE